MYAILVCTGWRRRLLAALLGACATAALPPFFLLVLLIPAFSGLLLLVMSAHSRRQAFFDGWWWGLGHFTTGLYWICISLYVAPEKFAWLTPFALFGLPSVLGIYTGLVTLALHYVVRGKRDLITDSQHTTNHAPWLILLFAGLWTLAEYARAHLFTGFPWNLTGYAMNASVALMQTASIWGIFGQGWLAVLLASVPALLVMKSRKALPLNIVALLVVISIAALGELRLEKLDSFPENDQRRPHIRVVQANIPQSLKFDPDTAMDGLRKHVQLTRSEGIEDIDIVIWPETAVPFYMSQDSELARDLGKILQENQLLITGGMREEKGGKPWKAWNSTFVINSRGELATYYDKHHLVPFGEYIPFRRIIPFIVENIAGGMGDFQTGPGPQTLEVDGLPPVSPLICYEAIFPDKATDDTGKAKWLVNLTNDAWFGFSTGPYQHLEMARLRAVEQGLPLVRAANTGVSAIFDAYGRELKRFALQEAGVIDVMLPQNAPETIYSRRGDVIILLIAISCLFIATFCSFYQKMDNNLVD